MEREIREGEIYREGEKKEDSFREKERGREK